MKRLILGARCGEIKDGANGRLRKIPDFSRLESQVLLRALELVAILIELSRLEIRSRLDRHLPVTPVSALSFSYF